MLLFKGTFWKRLDTIMKIGEIYKIADEESEDS